MSAPLPPPADRSGELQPPSWQLEVATETWMYLLRHGATENNVAQPPRLQGRRTDMPLSAAGRIQAGQAAELLRSRPIAAIYSSPLKRAWQTAEQIAAPLDLPIHVLEAITEIDVGQWEGRDWGEIERSEPEAFRRFIDDPGKWPYVGGESMGQVQERVVPALDGLLAQQAGQSIVVVSHNVVNRCYVAHLMGLPLKRARSISQDNCGINIIRRRGETASLITLNAAFHLG